MSRAMNNKRKSVDEQLARLLKDLASWSYGWAATAPSASEHLSRLRFAMDVETRAAELTAQARQHRRAAKPWGALLKYARRRNPSLSEIVSTL
jgi:hypothetical protein